MTGKWRNSIGLQVLQIGVASIVAPLILWIFSPDDSISLKWALPVLALLLILLPFLGWIACQYSQKSQNILPKLILVKTIENMGVICLFEPSQFYSHNAIVSLFFNDEGYERLIGLGYVDLTRFGGYLISNLKGDPLCHQPVRLIHPS